MRRQRRPRRSIPAARLRRRGRSSRGLRSGPPGTRPAARPALRPRREPRLGRERRIERSPRFQPPPTRAGRPPGVYGLRPERISGPIGLGGHSDSPPRRRAPTSAETDQVGLTSARKRRMTAHKTGDDAREREGDGARNPTPEPHRHRARFELSGARSKHGGAREGAHLRLPHPRRQRSDHGRHRGEERGDHAPARHGGVDLRRAGAREPARHLRTDAEGRSVGFAYPPPHRSRGTRRSFPEHDDGGHQSSRARAFGIRADGRAVSGRVHQAPRRPAAYARCAAPARPRALRSGGDHPRRPLRGGGRAHGRLDERPRRDRRGHGLHLRRRDLRHSEPDRRADLSSAGVRAPDDG